MTMPEFPRMMKLGSGPGDPVEPEARQSGPAWQSIRSSDLPSATPSTATDGDSLDAQRRRLSILGARADLVARTAGRNLTRDERRLLNHYEGVLAELEQP